MTETQPLSNANNSQNNHSNNNKHVVSRTTCVHGSTTFEQFLRSAADGDSAALKAQSFQNHQRILACNCTLS